MSADPRRALPSVEELLTSPPLRALATEAPRGLLVDASRAVLDDARAALSDGDATPPSPDELSSRVAARVAERLRPSLRPVLNATGVVLHTNLGRAPLPESAIQAMIDVSRGYSNLEYEIDSGSRGSRYDHCAGLLRELTGAQAALVVNNNAAAVVLALNTMALGRDVIVSRGELVEIGGSFRIADMVERAGARLVEVGATNKTRFADYERALGTRTGALLKVHRSNFAVRGFVEEVSAAELAPLARSHGVPLVHDLGSGLLLEPPPEPLQDETSAPGALADGATVVTMSGDKLLGGPQAGLIVGDADAVEAMRRNPLCRAVRPDRTTLAALEATLALYRDPERALKAVPALRMMRAPLARLRERAHRFAGRLAERGIPCEVRDGDSAIGGGAAPETPLPSALVLVRPKGVSADALLAALRTGEPPIVARIVDDRVALDLRTVRDDEEPALLAGVAAAVERASRLRHA